MSETAEDITKKVKDQEDTHFPLYQRYDGDYNRWNLTPYKLNNRKNTINITCNDPRTYSDKIVATLGASKRQIVIRMAEREGEDVRKGVGKLERLLDFGLEMADERLRRMGMPPLKDSLLWHAAHRGRTSVRVLVYLDGKDAVFDIIPLDPRWLTYEYGSDGLIWAAYKTFRTKAALLDEYNYTASKDLTPVLDYWKWDKEKKKALNHIICENELLIEPQDNKLRSLPILTVPISTRAPIYSESESLIETEGDSIYAGARDIFDMRNKLASIWATHAYIRSRQPVVNYKGPEGKDLHETVYEADRIINLVEGQNRLDRMPTEEVSATLVNLFGELGAQKQRGTLPDIEFGHLPFRLSGTAIRELEEQRDKAFGPITRNLGFIYSDICNLMEEQILAGGYRFKIQGHDNKAYYEEKITPVDLKRPHITKVEFVARTPWMQLDTYQLAQMAKQLGIPDEFIWENIMNLQDPQLLGDLMAIQTVSQDPVLLIRRAVDRLTEEGRTDEATYLMALLGKLSQEQLTEPTEVPPTGEGAPPTGPMGGAGEAALAPTPPPPGEIF